MCSLWMPWHRWNVHQVLLAGGMNRILQNYHTVKCKFGNSAKYQDAAPFNAGIKHLMHSAFYVCGSYTCLDSGAHDGRGVAWSSAECCCPRPLRAVLPGPVSGWVLGPPLDVFPALWSQPFPGKPVTFGLTSSLQLETWRSQKGPGISGVSEVPQPGCLSGTSGMVWVWCLIPHGMAGGEQWGC